MRFLFFLTFSWFFSMPILAQGINIEALEAKALNAFHNKDYNTSIKLFLQLEKVSDFKKKSFAQYALGHLYGKEKLDINNGIYWLKKNINTIKSDSTNYYFSYVISYSLLSDYYQYLGNRDSAEYFLKKGSSVYLKNKQHYKGGYPIIRKFNTFFYRRKEYNLSRDILNIILDDGDINYTTLSDYLSLCIQIGDNEGIVSTLKKINNYSGFEAGYHFYHLGRFYLEEDKVDQSIDHFNRYIQQYNSFYKNPNGYIYSNDEIKLRHYYIARTYLQIAKCYRELSMKTLQLEYLKKAEKEIKKGLSFPTQDMNVMAAEIYRAIDIYYHENNFRLTQNYLDSAQAIIDKQLSIHKGDTNQVLRNQLMLQNFYSAAFSKDTQHQKEHYWNAYLMFKEFIGKQYNDDDQLYQFKNLKEIQDQLITFFTDEYLKTGEQDNLIKTLEIIENSKSNILYKRSLGLENMTFEQYINTPNIDSLKNKIKSSPLLEGGDIQRYFNQYYTDKAFVSYYPIGKDIVMAGYNDEKFFLERRQLPENWENLLQQIKIELSKSNRFIDRVFNHQLQELGSVLLPQALEKSKVKRTVFSPSGNLSFIPFEILKVNEKYYLDKWAISYSFSLHHEYSTHQNSKISYAPLRVLGIAPFDKINLPYSLKEVNAITSNVLSNEKATLENTLQEMKKNNVLHLATHTTIGNTSKDSYIEFFPQKGLKNKLTFNDVANKDLSYLQLVTLSSCHSADGPYIDGEGTLSLHRAFAYANVHSVLASKWKVNDEVSAQIMDTFYEYLEEGWEKDIALQKAKIDFWSSNPSLKVNPIFWGNIILVGEADAITTPSLHKRMLEYLPFDF